MYGKDVLHLFKEKSLVGNTKEQKAKEYLGLERIVDIAEYSDPKIFFIIQKGIGSISPRRVSIKMKKGIKLIVLVLLIWFSFFNASFSKGASVLKVSVSAVVLDKTSKVSPQKIKEEIMKKIEGIN